MNEIVWILPFKGRNYSGAFDQNFVYKCKNVYIMDNHRAALWCWMQEMRETRKYNLMHIDMHTDTLYSNIEQWKQLCPELRNISLELYLDYNYKHPINGTTRIFQWDNYLSIFLEKHGQILSKCYFATHGEGDAPRHANIEIVDHWDLPGNIAYWMKSNSDPFIVNIDLDYFVYQKKNGDRSVLFSDQYILDLFDAIRKELNNICVLTMSLSPECTGGWPMAEELCAVACEVLGIKFQIPKM